MTIQFFYFVLLQRNKIICSANAWINCKNLPNIVYWNLHATAKDLFLLRRDGHQNIFRLKTSLLWQYIYIFTTIVLYKPLFFYWMNVLTLDSTNVTSSSSVHLSSTWDLSLKEQRNLPPKGQIDKLILRHHLP